MNGVEKTIVVLAVLIAAWSAVLAGAIDTDTFGRVANGALAAISAGLVGVVAGGARKK